MDIQVKITGDKTSIDKAVALRFGIEVNANRQAEADVANAGLSPEDNGYVVPTLLPLDTNQDIFDAYETYLSELLIKAHESYKESQVDVDLSQKDLKEWYKRASDTDKEAVLDIIKRR